MMGMAGERHSPPQIAVARPVWEKIDALPPDQQIAVRDALRTVGTVRGELVDLPTAPPGTPYRVHHTRLPTAPVLIYRKSQQSEPGDWLVVSLMTPEEYLQQKRDEQSEALQDPAVRQEIRIAAGTAVSVFNAPPGSVTVHQGGAASTLSNNLGAAEKKSH